jgi:A/G-specific adenine glycosylase
VPRLLEWFSREARDLPWRRTRDPYAIWISEVMLQQTQVKTVIPFYERWMSKLPNLSAVARAKPEKVLKLWEGLGYYTRARNLQMAAQTIDEKHGGKFPECFEEILALQGIGRYTAGAICSIAFNQPTPILDGNVIRVLARVFGISENPKLPQANARLWTLAQSLVYEAAKANPLQHRPAFAAHSAGHCSHLNQSLMELGALICTPKQPQCPVCPVQKSCYARQNGLTESLPNLSLREEPTSRHFMAVVAHSGNRVLVRQRPSGVVNAHLWEFPNVEVTGRKPGMSHIGKEIFGAGLQNARHLCTIKHTITRYRITLEAHRAELAEKVQKPSGAGKWCTASDLRKLAFPSAHRKIVEAVLNADFNLRP